MTKTTHTFLELGNYWDAYLQERGIARGKPEGWRLFSYALRLVDWQTFPLESIVQSMFLIIQTTVEKEKCDSTVCIVDDLKQETACVIVEFRLPEIEAC